MFYQSAGRRQQSLERPQIDVGATRRGRTEAALVAPAESRLFHDEAHEVDFSVVVPDAGPSAAQSLLLMEVLEKASGGGVEGAEWAKVGQFLERQYLRRGRGRMTDGGRDWRCSVTSPQA